MNFLIDTHCHLYLDEFKNDIAQVMQRAEEKGVMKFYLPAIDSSELNNQFLLEKRFPGKCIAMIGLHPCSVKDSYDEELRIIKDWLAKRRFAAIGEIGLDYYWDRSFDRQQIEAFHLQIEMAIQQGYPIVIHSRNSLDDCINIVAQYEHKGLRGIFHCFSGSLEAANRIMNLGFYLGIGGVLTYKNSGLDKVIENVSLDHIVLETDAPYLTPAPFRGKRNESSYLQYIVQKLAEVKSSSIEEVTRITTRNAQKIFGG